MARYAAITAVGCLMLSCRAAAAAAVDGSAFFESRIRPVLVEHCHECDAGDAAEGGLRLDSRVGFDAGGKSGRLIDEKQPSASLLLRLIRHEIKDREMPQGVDKLPDTVIADFDRWIASGLPGLPDAPPTPQASSSEAWAAKLAARRTHWAWTFTAGSHAGRRLTFRINTVRFSTASFHHRFEAPILHP
jgi:hypothetical protein